MVHLPSIVGIGASAGGLEALQEFMHAIPNDSGIAYVVIQHLAPDHESLMDQLLAAHTPVPVARIEDGGAIEPDHVYVIPPGAFLTIEGAQFRLTPTARESGVRTPIDRFFQSLADAAGQSAVAVVLSGTGSDGTMGVRAIKANGGIAIVQESHSARFPGMPDSAAATGLVDFVLRPQDMPGKILEIVRHRRQLDTEVGRDQLFARIEARLPEILDLVEDEGGHSFSGYKPGTLVRRVVRRMTLLRQSSVDGYLRALDDLPDERQRLTKDFLIGVTQFFRDPESYSALQEHVLTPLLARDQSSFRVWVPGCSTGEEAFSIALMVRELTERTGDRRSWKIFGTDIDVDALRTARSGHFADTSLDGLSEERRARFFTREDGAWRVNSALREMCVFAPHNLLQDPPFSRLDLVSCRNVMIYLNADSQEALLPRFHYALNPGSFLWLGPSETLGRSERFFRTIERGSRLFRRDDRTAPGFSAVTPSTVRRLQSKGLAGYDRQRPFPPGPQQIPGIETQSEQMFLQRVAAPFAVVNRSDEIVYLSEAMTTFVKPSRGAPSLSLDEFLRPELRLPVHSALDEVRETDLETDVRDIVVLVDGVPQLYDVRAIPFGGDSDLTLVALCEVRQGEAGAGIDDVERQAGYEQELLMTRKRLSSVERGFEVAEQELRSANEELLSMNEELQSSNEELETSREELQSINEELETINAELTENNRQLTRANSDLKNLLESTNIPTLFIDQSDRVRLYTPDLGRIFGLQQRDIGRSIHDLARNIDHPGLAQDFETVRRTLQPVQREVRIEANDETFSMRIRPYRTVDDRLDGLVVVFIDVTERKRDERQLEENARVLAEQYSELETLYDTAPIGLALVDRDLRYIRINATLAAINGFPVKDHIGTLQKILLPQVHAQVVEIQRRVLETAEPALGLMVQTETPAVPGSQRAFIVDFYPVKDGDKVVALGSCVRDITEQRRLERRIEESAVRQRIAVDAAGLGVFEWNMREDIPVWENDRMFEIFRRDPALGPMNNAEFGESVLHPDDAEPFARELERARQTGSLNAVARIRRPGDGALRYLQYFGSVLDGADGSAERLISVVADVTEQQEAQERDERHRNRLQRLRDSLTSFVGLLDTDGTLLEANATALERGGLTREDVVGKKLWDCWWWSFSEESQDRLRAAFARAMQGETVRYDVPARFAHGRMLIIDFQLVPILDADGRVIEVVPSAIDVTERLRAEERKDILLAELEHRVKNTLATVQAITRFTARMSGSKEQMADSLVERLSAMARSHDALTARGWEGQDLRALVEAEILSFVDPASGRFTYIGDNPHLEPQAVLSLGLAMHELATNAAKYGAFSADEGRVEFTAEADEAGFTRLEWREIDGPKVSPPDHEGFGTFLVQTLLGRELDADIILEYRTDGLSCVIRRKKSRGSS